MGAQVAKQFLGAGATIVYCGVVSFILLKIIDAVIGLRVDRRAGGDGPGSRAARRDGLQPALINFELYPVGHFVCSWPGLCPGFLFQRSDWPTRHGESGMLASSATSRKARACGERYLPRRMTVP